MNLDRIAAEAFLEELHKIAAAGVDEGTKTAAMTMLDNMDVELVEQFLKEAGLGGLIAGVGRGIGGLASGAARGAGSMIAGAGRGVANAATGAVTGAGQAIRGGLQRAGTGIKGSLQSAGQAIAAAPGRLGQGLTNMGQRAEQGLAGMGQRLQAAGQAKGQALSGVGQGPMKPASGGAALRDIAMHQQANAAPAAAAPGGLKALQKMQGTENAPKVAPYKPPMMGAGELMADANPFHGMLSSAVQNVRGILQSPPGLAPPGTPARQAATFGTLVPGQ